MDHMLSPVLDVLHFSSTGNDDIPKKIDLLSNTMSKKVGNVSHGISVNWSTDLKIVNDNFMIGKLYSQLLDDIVDIPNDYI